MAPDAAAAEAATPADAPPPPPEGTTDNNDGDNDEHWVIQYCCEGWQPLADRLDKLLPPWATLRRFDPTRPLHKQSEDVHVFIPTTGVVDRAAIFAARPLRLIAQPAAGYGNIDVAAAQERGVPVTTAPGNLVLVVCVLCFVSACGQKKQRPQPPKPTHTQITKK